MGRFVSCSASLGGAVCATPLGQVYHGREPCARAVTAGGT